MTNPSFWSLQETAKLPFDLQFYFFNKAILIIINWRVKKEKNYSKCHQEQKAVRKKMKSQGALGGYLHLISMEVILDEIMAGQAVQERGAQKFDLFHSSPENYRVWQGRRCSRLWLWQGAKGSRPPVDKSNGPGQCKWMAAGRPGHRRRRRTQSGWARHGISCLII